MSMIKTSAVFVTGFTACSFALGPCGQRSLATGVRPPNFDTTNGFVQNVKIFAQHLGGDYDGNSGSFPNGAMVLQFVNPSNASLFSAILPLDWDWALRVAANVPNWKVSNQLLSVLVCKDAVGNYYLERVSAY